MSNFNLQHWYKGAVAASVALMALGAIADERSVIGFAIGLMLVGFGEWINHPFITSVHQHGFDRIIASGEVRRNKPLGVAIAAVGTFVCIVSLGRIVVSLFQ